MLKRCIYNWMMSIRIGEFMTPMKINTITIEKRSKLGNRYFIRDILCNIILLEKIINPY
jgi:hypothetical protein